MPVIPPNNQYWWRGGKLNQKRHIDMTDDEKANISLCSGERANHPCKNPVFRCSECGNYGCAQEVAEKCTAQGFKNDKCMICGAMGTRIPIMEDEFAKYVEEWNKKDI